MATPPRDAPLRSAAVIVRDEALGVSLQLMLQAYGVVATVHPADAGLEAGAMCSFVIMDHSLLPPDAGRTIEGVRARGWRGLLIVLTEDVDARSAPLTQHDGVVVLEKPFGSRALVALLTKPAAPEA